MSEKNRIDIGDIERLFPEIKFILDEEISKKCKDALLLAFEMGGWTNENIGQCPVSIAKVKTNGLNSQIDHARVVARIALGVYEELEETYSMNTDLKDLIIAGALLHDLGKFTEFKLDEGLAGYSDSAKLIRHPLGGAIIASKAGLNNGIVHIIATHSFEGRESHETLASMIVKLADDVSFKYITSFNKD